ncbi:UDP-4-amino-4,6-dideoxy-N-acetyl-beta-L-altrosamine transaminase [Pontibacter sp. G13]|uniref:UDP-4-amino-4, 6-dideoxy-N-acetyl-beta-L-altrosamine transaminase n=1 Tax=Pontibacter sp. G13 TaxID=3074898 RepID=UPI002889DB37|nr:UDP-4-amino-4,6-dideoxy-N-acetyl-beta-L-altrosamine transaminase [Pontibacter sp. G13]WNJ21501.1 UDP-4-amino-4,6-dideoxy-N-acetyl-beta-L-altrosamine transaminase [Pontibacter sp. G13]
MQQNSGPIPYGRQEITQADIDAVVEALQSDYLTGGPRIGKFEEAFAQYVDAPYAVAVSSGTAALHLCTLALGIQPGQKVITSPLTFAASANCILYAGGEVDFVDIDPRTGLMDLDLLEEKLHQAEAGTYAGIIPVNYAGHPVDMERVANLAKRHGCWVLEDACHAPGGYFINQAQEVSKVGNGLFTDLAMFSLHPVKHIAAGEGGVITTRDPKLYEQLVLLRSHGITRDRSRLTEDHGGWYYEMQELGFNYRLTDIQAALAHSQLANAASGVERRREIAAHYREVWKGLPIQLPENVEGHAYHLFVIRTERRKELYNFMRSHKVFVQVHYIPVHYQPYYQRLGWKKGDFPHSEAFYNGCLSMPMYPSISDESLKFATQIVQSFFH